MNTQAYAVAGFAAAVLTLVYGLLRAGSRSSRSAGAALAATIAIAGAAPSLTAVAGGRQRIRWKFPPAVGRTFFSASGRTSARTASSWSPQA